MMALAWLLVAATGTALLTAWVRAAALARGRLDVPNARSSHTQPTPRGGGLAIAIIATAGCAMLWARGLLGLRDFLGSALGGALIAAVGYIDDVRGVTAAKRFGVHALSASLAVGLLTLSETARPFFPQLPTVVVLPLLVLAMIWSVNLFNFMDGINGIAGSQAAFVAGAAALLAALAGGHEGWIALGALTAGASLGFLPWNWPSGKIFMGDVGSGFLGFWLAAVAIGLHASGSLSIWTSAMLASVFLADATVTLLRRAARGERWYEAHRSHAYQILSRRWASHDRVTLLVWLINVLIVLPLAYASTVWQQAAPWIAVGAIAAASLGCMLVGAGSRAEPDRAATGYG